jgi:membrane-associated protein
VAAVLGDNVGYWFGRKAGPHCLRVKILLFRPKNLLAAHAFYEKHGRSHYPGALYAFIRTFAPVWPGQWICTINGL